MTSKLFNPIITPALVVVGLLLGLTTSYGQSWLTNGLVAYYPFNGNANDASGNGNNGTNYNATYTTNRFGQSSGAIRFRAISNSAVQTAFFPPLGTSARTFSFWICTTNTEQMDIWGYGGAENYAGDRVEVRLLPYQGSTGLPAFGTTLAGSYPSVSCNNGAWRHIALVIPTNAELANIEFYVDGIRRVPVTLYYAFPGSVFINTLNRFPLRFGNNGANSETYYTGLLDDFRVYNRALSSNEVGSLFFYESKKQITIVKQYTLDFDGLAVGTNYQLQVSTNFLSWSNWGTPFTATTDKYTNAIPSQRVDQWSKMFFRLVPQ